MKSLALYVTCFAIPALFAEIPESTLKVMPPMVEVYHPVSTTNSEAQKSFDKGLTYIFAFNHDIAFAAFERAAELDPTLAMAYWGMALAKGQNINADVTRENEIKCYNFIQKALALSDTASASEKAYIEALAVRYTNDPNADLIPLRVLYREAMKKLAATYPEDLDAVTMYAESILDIDPWLWWTLAGEPREGTMEAIENLEFVLRRNPLHIGANHYIIHSWEESPTPERALMSANRLEFLLPESGHLMHMPCHIFLPLGYYDQAVHNSHKAIALDQAYFAEVGLTAGTYPLHYLSHNMYILGRTYMLMEDYDNAIKTTLELSSFAKTYLEALPHLTNFTRAPIEIYLYFHKWKEVLEYPLPVDAPYIQAYWHYSRAKAFAYQGDMASASKEQELMMQYKQQIPENEKIAYNPARSVIELAGLDLDATIAYVQKKYPECIALFNQAIELQDRFNYDEPPSWSTPLRLSLGAVLLQQQKYAEAEIVFLTALKKLQRNSRTLFGLFLSLKGQNRESEAYWIKREMTAALRQREHAPPEVVLIPLQEQPANLPTSP